MTEFGIDARLILDTTGKNVNQRLNDHDTSLLQKANQTDLNNVQKFKLTDDTGLPFNLADDATKLIDTLTTPGFYYLDGTNLVPDPLVNTPSYTLQVGYMWKTAIVWQLLMPYQWISGDDKYIFYRNTKNSDGLWTTWRAIEFSSRSVYLDQSFNDVYNKVITLQNQYTKSIGFITDSHYIRNSAPPYGINGKKHVQNISHFSKMGLMDFVLHGGDLINGKTAPATYKAELFDMINAMLTVSVPRAVLKGNHDFGGWYNANTSSPLLSNELSPTDWFNRAVKPFQKDIIVDSANVTGGYFFKDFDDVKLRVICLNTSDLPYLANGDGSPKYTSIDHFSLSNAQLNWLANTALMVTGKTDNTNWNVVIFSHVPLYGNDNLLKVTNGDIAHNIIKAFKAGTSYTSTTTTGDFGQSVTVNFTGKSGRHVANISGHYHDDVRYVYDTVQYMRMLLNAQADSTSTLTTDTRPRTEGTVLEDSWSVFTIDTNARKLYISRFGQGDDGITITY